MARYAFGIGAISDLSYSYPWGFWISFDLFTGVVISSGGFLMAGSVYILGIKEFQPLAASLRAHRLPGLHHGRHCPAR
jgi:Ni/Fe-hydrogenase subunit HybB-like protein